MAAASPVGAKRGTGRGGFIDSVLAAIDGFYGAVVQEVRPWTVKAPQLPKGDKTAVEQAGIDIEPPPGDLVEPAGPEVSGGVPPEAPTPEIIEEGVEAGAQAADEAHEGKVGVPASDVAEDEFVSWDAAQDRLDYEVRELEGPVQ